MANAKSKAKPSSNSKSKGTSKGSSKSSTRSTSKGSSKSASAAKKPSSSKSTQGKRSLGAEPAPAPKRSMLSLRIRNDLIGIIIIVVALVILLAVARPGDAIFTNLVSNGLRTVFGFGAYLLPIFIIVFGCCFFLLGRKELVLSRIAIGLLLIFIALDALIGVNAKLGSFGYDHLFTKDILVAYGGYMGNGIAYLLNVYLGKVIAWILMLALIICGIVLIGFSISKMIEKIMDRRNPVEPELVANRAASPYARSASASLRNSTGKTRVLNSAPETVALNAAAPTRMLDNNGEPAGLLPDASPRTRKLANREGRSEIKVDQKMDSILPTVSLNDPIASGKADKAEEKPKEAAKKSSKKKPVDRDKGGFTLPDFKMLSKSTFTLSSKTSDQELASLGARLQSTLREFNVGASVVGWVHGPTVTLFKIALDSGVRVKAIHALSKDIALSLAAESVRIFSPIKGTSFVGIEIPNPTRDNVLLGDVLPETGGAVLTMAIGKDVEGDAITADLSKMPHLLVGGTTGSGKSVALNSMIMSILMRATPNEVRFIMVDPKRVELSLYNDIPHLYVPVVTDPNKAASALAWAVNEMERRLELLEEVGVRDIFQYNETREKEAALAAGREKLDELGVDEGVDADEIPEPLEEMPFIVIVIDELADLMMTNGKDVETSICRIAQKARAVGIHLIVATQRPSANIVTGVIKSNITSRIAFNVASGIDSRVILDTTGAENLVGHGDMLFIRPGSSEPMRIQGCYVSEEEINSVVAYLKSQSKPGYHDEIFNTKAGVGLLDGSGSAKGGSADDDLVWDAAEIVVNSGIGSTSTIQRRLSVGYARAGRIMDQLEEKGIVGPANGSKPREVLVDAEELEGIKAMWANDYL